MLGAVLLFGVLAGVDNFQVCSSVGLLPIDLRRRHLLALAFSLCETVAPLLGLLLGHLLLQSLSAAAAKAAPLLMLFCGGAVLVGATWRRNSRLVGRDSVAHALVRAASRLVSTRLRPGPPGVDTSVDAARTSACATPDPSELVSGPTLLFGLPLSLSFDNLLGGAGIAALNYPMIPAALMIGLVSAAMSCAGLYLGGYLRRLFQWPQWCLEPAVGAYLCLLAVRLLLANRS